MTEQEIIDKAVEKTLLMIPEVIGNLMMNQAVINKLNSKFYSDHKDFADKKELVASVIEEVEGANPSLKYEDILEKSIPKIKERIRQVKELDNGRVNFNVNRRIDNVDFSDNNGEI